MSVLAWIVVGLIAGWLASMVMPGVSGGVLTDIVVGILGALLGGVLFRAFGAAGPTGINIWSILVSFVGAVILLGIVKAVQTRRV